MGKMEKRKGDCRREWAGLKGGKVGRGSGTPQLLPV